MLDDPGRRAHTPSTDHRALRFLTAGSVDDGKSTLIGRLLYDSQAILADQLDTLRASAPPAQPIDLSLLTDGLEAEREQGITIDVAYRYFATRERKFIIADAPGHEQYTRNMVTAAAGSDAAVVLVDITKLDWRARGRCELLPQTRRHALLAQLLRVPSIVFAVNKLDAVDRPRAAFERGARRAATPSPREAGIDGGRHRAGLGAARRQRHAAARRAVVRRPVAAAAAREPADRAGAHRRRAAAAGAVRGARIAATAPATSRARCGAASRTGRSQAGDAVQVLPERRDAPRVAEVPPRRRGGRRRAQAGQSAGVVLDRQLDVSRGDWIADARRAAAGAALHGHARLARHRAGGRRPQVLGAPRQPLGAGAHQRDRAAGSTSTRSQPTDAHELAVNDIGEVTVETQQPLPLEPYADNRVGGALIVVDPASQPHQRRAAGATAQTLRQRQSAMGTSVVIFVGAGPGAADLITLRGARRLAAPTWCCTTRSTDPALRELAPQARWIDVGKRGFCALAPAQARDQRAAGQACARQRRVVVRLKGGDPSVFGRLEEELQALAAAGIAMRGGARRHRGARRRRRDAAPADAPRQPAAASA